MSKYSICSWNEAAIELATRSCMKPQQLEVAVAIVEGMQGHFFAVLSRILEKSLLTSGV